MNSKWLWIAGIAVAGYAAYEWMQTQCATAGSSMFGGSLCNSLFPSTFVPVATAPVQTSIPVSAQVNAGPVLIPSGTGPGSVLTQGPVNNPIPIINGAPVAQSIIPLTGASS
jgi:hypothetical protein